MIISVGLSFEVLEPIQVKGKTEKVPIFKPAKSAKNKENLVVKIKQSLKQHRPLFGRKEEMKILKDVLAAGSGCIVIEGEAGLGTNVMWCWIPNLEQESQCCWISFKDRHRLILWSLSEEQVILWRKTLLLRYGRPSSINSLISAKSSELHFSTIALFEYL